ncbi:hypothetical protein ACLB2K_022545 [Fragaria x ananassa]
MLPRKRFRYGSSYMESDPVKTAMEGVEALKENCDLIIVDNLILVDVSNRKLLLSKRCVRWLKLPNLILLYLGWMGGGALSVVVATKSPDIFIGIREHMDQFDVFDVEVLNLFFRTCFGSLRQLTSSLPGVELGDVCFKPHEYYTLRLRWRVAAVENCDPQIGAPDRWLLAGEAEERLLKLGGGTADREEWQPKFEGALERWRFNGGDKLSDHLPWSGGAFSLRVDGCRPWKNVVGSALGTEVGGPLLMPAEIGGSGTARWWLLAVVHGQHISLTSNPMGLVVGLGSPWA